MVKGSLSSQNRAQGGAASRICFIAAADSVSLKSLLRNMKLMCAETHSNLPLDLQNHYAYSSISLYALQRYAPTFDLGLQMSYFLVHTL